MDFNFPSHLSKSSSHPAPSGWQIVKWAISQANKYFLDSVLNISFSIVLLICVFLPFWVYYIRTFGVDSQLVDLVEWLTLFSLQIFILFNLSIFLFNKTHPDSQSLKMWSWTKQITWPWLVDGVKSTVIIVLGILLFIVPGIIKSIHYTFFSFVIFFNRSFKEGKISSLKHSKYLSEGLRWWILLSHVVLGILYYLTDFLYTILLDFSHSYSDWVLYPTLGAYIYLQALPCVYCVTIWYFMYFVKDQEQMIGSSE